MIYHLLFCDRPELYRPDPQSGLMPPWSTLFAEPLDLGALARMAGDVSVESRVRMLAFHLLRAARQEVPKKDFLGAIIEVRMPTGLDTLATFTDGSARYINQTGKMTVVEGLPNPFQTEIEGVLEASRKIVAVIGPWDKDRLPAPVNGNIRMSFLVSDGLYFGEGPMTVMQKDPMAAPLIHAATALLVKIVEKTINP